jgi:hypothetical protein
MHKLAADYLFKNVDEVESSQILDRIRTLSTPELADFGSAVVALAELSAVEADAFERALARAEELGLSYLDLPDDELGRIIEDLSAAADLGGSSDSDPTGFPATSAHHTVSGALCIPGYASCSTTTLWNKNLYGMSCASGCTKGTYSDRVSNEKCELLGCDYRMRFTRSFASTIDGTTAAADCTINKYPGILAYSAGSYTYALFGIKGPLFCGLPTKSVHQYFQVK